MKRLLLCSLGCILGMMAMAQAAFVINRGSVALSYRSLDSAVSNAQQGDTLYLPGGTFNTGNTGKISVQVKVAAQQQ